MRIKVGKENKILISGLEYKFKSSFDLNFITWFGENKDSMDSKEISLECIKSLQLNKDSFNTELLSDNERLEILNEIAKINKFNDFPVNNYYEFIQGVCSYIKKAEDKISDLFLEFSERLKEFPDNLRSLHELLAKEGWYILPTFLLRIAPRQVRELGEVHKEDRNKIMIELAKETEIRILDSVKKHYEDRYEIVNDALEAHEKGKYNLSIPILLAQCDGICKKIIDNYLFMKQGNRKNKIRELKTNKEISDTIFLYPLEIVNAITANEYERASDNTLFPFNRHEILHGDDLSYGTKENSYRCIMLLEYLMEVKSSIVKYE